MVLLHVVRCTGGLVVLLHVVKFCPVEQPRILISQQVTLIIMFKTIVKTEN